MATYVLVHGGNVSTDTWNRLTRSHDYPPGRFLGGECWKPVVAGLEQHGHRAFAPDLEDENTHTLSDHIAQVCSLITDRDLHDVILVGHSYGGMVITGVASRIPERLQSLVYLDADFPDSGQSLFDILEGGGFDPGQVVGGRPPAYTEKLVFNPDPLQRMKKVYILCTQSEFSAVTATIIRKIDFKDPLWQYFELPTGHFSQATMPDKLNRILLGLSEPTS